jgi:hypothetical protein
MLYPHPHAMPLLQFDYQYIFALSTLTLEGERGSDLVAGLVELVGVEGQTKADGGASVELGAVSKGSNTAVVDLGL